MTSPARRRRRGARLQAVARTAGALAVLGCGSTGGGGLLGEVGTYDADSGVFAGSDASAADGLDAHIEQDGLEVTLVTLTCSGGCADVEAVASGGRPPYGFSWDDGATGPTRRVCPTANTHYLVTVTDTGSAGEIARPPQRAQASLTAQVLACPDAGDGAAPEGGQSPLCLTNPSFEGTAQIDVADVVAPPWHTCDPYPDVLDGVAGGVTLRPSDGRTFIDLQDYPSESDVSESIGQALCAPLRAGGTAHVKIDAASETSGSSFRLQFYGAATACQEEQLLGETGLVSTSGAWTTECVTLHAGADASFLKIRVGSADSTLGGVMAFLDNLRIVDSCP